MPFIIIEGNSILKNNLYNVAIFTLQHLFSNIPEDLEITIVLYKNLYKKYNIFGDILNLEDNEYLIRIDSENEEIHYTLIHELVHCWQYCNNIVDDNKNYHDRITEIEAYNLEKIIYEEYVRKNNTVDRHPI